MPLLIRALRRVLIVLRLRSTGHSIRLRARAPVATCCKSARAGFMSIYLNGRSRRGPTNSLSGRWLSDIPKPISGRSECASLPGPLPGSRRGVEWATRQDRRLPVHELSERVNRPRSLAPSRVEGAGVVPQTVPVPLWAGTVWGAMSRPPAAQARELRPEGPDATERNDAGWLDGALAVHVDPEHVAPHVVGVGQREVRERSGDVVGAGQ